MTSVLCQHPVTAMASDNIGILDYDWQCPTCTLLNKASRFKCSACGTLKGTSTRQVKYHMSTLEQQYVAESLQSMTKFHGSRSGSKVAQSTGSITSSSGATSVTSTSTGSNTGVSTCAGSSKKKVKSRAVASTSLASSSSSSTSGNSKARHNTWPRLPNIDRTSGRSVAITVNSMTVVITEYDTLYSDSD